MQQGGELTVQDGAAVAGGNGGEHKQGYWRTGSGGAGVVSIGPMTVIVANGATVAGGAVISGVAAAGSGGAGLDLQSGGTVFNSGTISGGFGASGAGGGGVGRSAGGTGSGGAPGFKPGVSNAGGGGMGIVGANLSVINSGAIAGGLNTLGVQANAITFTGGTNLLELRQGFSFTGNVAASGTSTLRLGGAANAAFDLNNLGSGFQGFSSLEKNGISAWTLTGTSTFGGPTALDAGTLFMNGSLANSAFTVSGGILGGSGTVGTTIIGASGTLSPGNSIGTMTVQGALTFQAGSSYLVEVDPNQADRTDATGVATLAGTVNAQFTPGSYLTRRYTIVAAQGGVTGSFGALQTTNLPSGFKVELGYESNQAWLQIIGQLGMGASNLTVNQQSTTTALNDYFNNGGTLPSGFVTLFGLTGDALRNALNQASGESGASISTSTFMAWNSFFNMIFDPFAQNRGGFGGAAMSFAADANAQSDAVRLAYAAVTPKRDLKDAEVTNAPALADPFGARWSVWGGGYGGSANTAGNAQVGSHHTTSRAYGFTVGADHLLSPDTLIGFALAGGGTSFGLDQGLGGGKSDVFQASFYARRSFGAAYLMGAFGYGWQDFTLNRTVTIAGTDKLEAKFDAHTLAGRAEGGWRFGSALAGVTPYAALQVASLDLPSYAEHATSGASTFALSYAGRTDTQTRSELGARFDYAMSLQNALLTLRGRAAWAHDYDTDRVANAGFMALPGTAFTADGARPDSDALLISAGAELALLNGLSISGSFEGEFSGNTQSYAGKGGIRYRW